jgi:hypothetical protein
MSADFHWPPWQGPEAPNPGMQLTNPDAAHSASWSLCLLSGFAADSHVRQISNRAGSAETLPKAQAHAGNLAAYTTGGE